MKAKMCDKCEHFFVKPDIVCDKGHKPRFYSRKDYYSDDYGYKRKCGDYSGGRGVAVIKEFRK